MRSGSAAWARDQHAPPAQEHDTGAASHNALWELHGRDAALDDPELGRRSHPIGDHTERAHLLRHVPYERFSQNGRCSTSHTQHRSVPLPLGTFRASCCTRTEASHIVE